MMKINVQSEEIEKELREIANILKQPYADDFFRQFVGRLADIEARVQKIERCLLRTTTAGKTVANDEGKEVAKLWYNK